MFVGRLHMVPWKRFVENSISRSDFCQIFVPDFNWDFCRWILFLLRFVSREVSFINRYLVMTSGRNSLFLITNGVFIIWRKASLLCRDPVSQLKPLWKCIFVYTRGRPALLRWILLLGSCLGGLEIFHIYNFPYTVNALKRAGPPPYKHPLILVL